MPNVSTEHKNNVFCLLYRDRKYLLSLYNAMNGTDYQDEDQLHAICLSMKNDAAFLISSQLNLYEHQSSVNDNIPLRLLYYIAEEYKNLVDMRELYRRSKISIPVPHFIVFYNGADEQPEKRVLRLSELYGEKTKHPELELVVTQYNINPGYNQSILEKCESLRGYMTFVGKVRNKTGADVPVEQAVREAVGECIDEGILTDFFREHRSEVVKMGIYEFDAEVYEQVLKEENWELGKAAGEDLKLIQLVCRKLAKNKSIETIAEELEEDPGTIRRICAAAAKYAPDYDVQKILTEYKAQQ